LTDTCENAERPVKVSLATGMFSVTRGTGTCARDDDAAAAELLPSMRIGLPHDGSYAATRSMATKAALVK